jgi:serine/threonine protein kinase
LKAANIFLRVDEYDCVQEVKIGDFGLTTNEISSLKAGQDTQGTVMYMAPEMLTVDSEFDTRIEAWALGIILCKMLTGRCPFFSTEEDRLVRKIVLEEIDFMDEIYSNLSIEAEDLIDNLLNKN